MGYIQNAPNKDFWIIKDNSNVNEEFLLCNSDFFPIHKYQNFFYKNCNFFKF